MHDRQAGDSGSCTIFRPDAPRRSTLLTTEECLCHPNRNPGLSKADIEAELRARLGVSTIIWLPRGLVGDVDTNGHVDNLACFVRPGVVMLSWCEDPADPQSAVSAEALAVLEAATDAKGRKLQVVKLPLQPPMAYTQEEVQGLVVSSRRLGVGGRGEGPCCPCPGGREGVAREEGGV